MTTKSPSNPVDTSYARTAQYRAGPAPSVHRITRRAAARHPALLLLPLALAACTEVAEYRVSNRAIDNYQRAPDNFLEGVKVIEGGMINAELPMPALPHTERVRLALPQYGAGNAYLSVASAWKDSTSDGATGVRMLVEFEGWREVDFRDANKSYKGARLHIPCAGWSLEIEGRSYPLEAGFCDGEIKLGDERYGSAVLRFQTPRSSSTHFTLRSPPWRMDDGLLNNLPEAERIHYKVQPPAITFERTINRKLAIGFSIH